MWEMIKQFFLMGAAMSAGFCTVAFLFFHFLIDKNDKEDDE
jgi:hypothetical protein